MFKKNISVSSTHQLSGKDGKELRKSVLKAFPAIAEEELSLLLPGKSGLVQTKLSNRCVVYSQEGGNPLFFDPDGRGGLLPTVYALAVLPQLLPQLHTWSEVSGKVLGGADLFLQGVLMPQGGLPDFLAGSPRTLCVPGNPTPFAVGKMAVSKAEALREGMKGRGWTLLHSYGDLLWQLGDKAPPNDGFTAARIFPTQAAIAAAEAAAAAAAAGNEGGDGGSSDAMSAAVGEAAEQLGGLQLAAGGGSADAGGAAGGAEGSSEAGSSAAAGGAGAGGAVDMDSLLEAAVLAGLQSLKNADLPIQAGDFYTKHMVPAKPEGVMLDIKASKYKKLSKLLDKFEKDKVITQKVVRKQDCITAVNRSHPAYTGFAGMQAAGAAAGAGNGGAAAGGSSSGGSGRGSSGSSKVQITYCYRAPSSLRPVFGEAGARDKDRLYSEAEVAEALADYAAAQGLASPGGRTIKLDRLLAGSLFNKKEPEGEGSDVPAAALRKRLLDKLQLHHRLVRPSEQGDVEVVRKGQVKPIVISGERRFGRNITAVSHVESFALSPDEMAGVLQRKFQTSCSVSKLPGKDEKDHEIMMQGDLHKQVAAFLAEQFGIPPALMEVKSKGK
ncbi:Eukaryotic translation initiation factor 2D [Chlorella sorokiniana]|uniref:Eukaryotic translation initiation factor 2D n=1 Tax=Chlorella sorokiniana TaxID=3076 RepID=A0A2P6TFV1_CHLSO|nr:Eukaryotic translation initiation factor 2D [Chlorella sorokiniana]|eukprot:PRW32977.1 Eukaryotic translation initiation factor 2D [Chlorella sorokiniana]